MKNTQVQRLLNDASEAISKMEMVVWNKDYYLLLGVVKKSIEEAIEIIDEVEEKYSTKEQTKLQEEFLKGAISFIENSKYGKPGLPTKTAKLGKDNLFKRMLSYFKSKLFLCKHERFAMDLQIRTIQCTNCGMRSWLEKEHIDLFKGR